MNIKAKGKPLVTCLKHDVQKQSTKNPIALAGFPQKNWGPGGWAPIFYPVSNPQHNTYYVGGFCEAPGPQFFWRKPAKTIGFCGSVRILEGGGPPFFIQFRTPNIIPIMLGVFVKPLQDPTRPTEPNHNLTAQPRLAYQLAAAAVVVVLRPAVEVSLQTSALHCTFLKMFFFAQHSLNTMTQFSVQFCWQLGVLLDLRFLCNLLLLAIVLEQGCLQLQRRSFWRWTLNGKPSDFWANGFLVLIGMQIVFFLSMALRCFHGPKKVHWPIFGCQLVWLCIQSPRRTPSKRKRSKWGILFNLANHTQICNRFAKHALRG